MYELAEYELDVVAAGQPKGIGGAVAGGLVAVAAAVGANVENIDIIDDNTVTVENVANNNRVGLGVLVNVLGGPAAIVNAP